MHMWLMHAHNTNDNRIVSIDEFPFRNGDASKSEITKNENEISLIFSISAINENCAEFSMKHFQHQFRFIQKQYGMNQTDDANHRKCT